MSRSIVLSNASGTHIAGPHSGIDGHHYKNDRRTYRLRFELDRRRAGLAQTLTNASGGTLLRTYGTALKGFAARLPDHAARALASHPDVAYVEPDFSVRLNTTQPNPPNWGLDRIDQSALPLSTTSTYSASGSGVDVYIMDTGIRRTHVEFGGRANYVPNGQWTAAGQRPPHLATIVPAASSFIGVDFPTTRNIFRPYAVQWLTQVSGRTLQLGISTDESFWKQHFHAHFLAHGAFRDLDRFVGNPLPAFREWTEHPHPDAYVDRYNPSDDAQYAAMELPILTIIGQFDSDQAGALEHYRRHIDNTTERGREQHYLLIGPWDHAQTRTPTSRVGGLDLAASSVLDLNDLHRRWYDWTLKGRQRPDFLRKRVAYYVTGADVWRYRDTLAEVMREQRAMYLASEGGSANDVFGSGGRRRSDRSRARQISTSTIRSILIQPSCK